MSTRCQIAIYESKEKADKNEHHALLYKHSDGYPEGVLPTLEPFLKQFKGNRGLDDAEYLSAWVLYTLMEKNVKSSIELGKEIGFSDTLPSNGMCGTGFGICTGMHGDIEFLYKIYPDTLEVYEVGWHGVEPLTFKLLERIAI